MLFLRRLEPLRKQYVRLRLRNAPRYANPRPAELDEVEKDLISLGIKVFDYNLDSQGFQDFLELRWFPVDYHGGIHSGVWHEKLLEHYIAKELLGLDCFDSSDVYVDIAACSSPWAAILRDKLGINSYANDLAPVPKMYEPLPFYKSEDATHSGFPDQSVKGASP